MRFSLLTAVILCGIVHDDPPLWHRITLRASEAKS
jgi:hypothetical protein